VDRRNSVGKSAPSHPSRDGSFGNEYYGDGHAGQGYAGRDRFWNTYRGNERESAYRGRGSGPAYGRRAGEVRGDGDGGSALYGPGRFGVPVDPWDETRAATETWFTVATHLAPPASRSDIILRSTKSRMLTDEDTAAQDTVTDLFEHSDPDRTGELAVLRRPPAVDQPRWARSEAISDGTVYRSATATATFAPLEIEQSDPTRRRAIRLGRSLHVRPRWFRLRWFGPRWLGLRWLGLRWPRPGRARTRRVQTTGRRSPIWAKLFIAIGALIMIVGIGAIIVVKIGLNQVSHAIPTENLLGELAAKPAVAAAGPSIRGPINFLLVGVDTRAAGNSGSHSDTIIIAHIPASHDRVYLVSIPRDTSTIIPADSATQFGGGSYKINAAFTFGSWHGGGEAGGFQLLAKTIKNAYGITFNGGAIVNFGGFTDIINKLGGVTMYVDETTVSIHRGTESSGKPAKPYNIDPNTGVPTCPSRNITFDTDPLACALPGVTPVVYKKGQRHLTAADALDFVRSRDGLVGTDYARQRHQQQFIKAVLAEVYQKGLSDPFEMGSFLKSVGKAFVFDGGGVSLQDWLFALKGITPGSMITIKTNDGKFVRYAGPAPDSRQSLNATSMELVAAVRDDRSKADTVGQFVAAHPDWVAQS
jgi:polyisoprenyl-teichoic acid--peptidoglycan teichoic acid transferase